MGFSSVDALYNAITVDGKILTVPWVRTVQTGATSAAGRWHEMYSTANGTGGQGVLTGTAGAGLVKDSTSVGALPIGPAVETAATKHLLSMMVVTNQALVCPGTILLTDIIHVYPSCVLTGTPSTLSNHPTWTGTGDTRMTNPKGVQVSVFSTTANTAGNGQITLTYVDQDNNSAQAQTGSLYSNVAAHPIGAAYAQTNAAVTTGGVNMAMAVGDYGVKQVNSYVINTGGTAGVGAIIMHRPVCTIPIPLANLPAERDFTTGPIRLPRIYDGACLAMFVCVGGALTVNQNIQGELVFGWG